MKKIILTGSASGFGLLTVKTLATAGHTIYATMRNIKGSNAGAAAELKQWAADHKVIVEVVELDVTNQASVAAAIVEIAEKSTGQIDVLINNAGLSFMGISETLTIAQSEQIFQVNLIGPDRMIKAVLPFMHLKKSGLIINVTSVQSRNHIPGLSTYNASKAGLDALSVGYHYELKSAGIDLVTVQPGSYQTTDIIYKSLVAGNPDAEAFYGADMIKLKDALFTHFVPNEHSANPQEVADVIAGLVNQQQGQRPLWNIVGGGPLTDAFNDINESTRKVVDTMLGYLIGA